MSDGDQRLRGLYEAVYGEISPAHQSVRRDGHLPGDDIGQCGYTLPEQLRRLAALLDLGPGRRFLDVGCGLGGPTRYLARYAGCEGMGVDFAWAGVARARGGGSPHLPAASPNTGRGGAFGRERSCSPLPVLGEGLGVRADSHRSDSFLVADAASLPFRSECCDAVVSFDVMLYLPDREGFLRECRRVLRPGGRVAFVDEVERGAGLTPEEREERALFGPAVYDTEQTHRDRLRRAGFTGIVVEDWTPAFVALNARWCAARERHRAALVAEGGEAACETGCRYFATNRDAARDGRLRRLLLVGVRHE